MKKLSIKETLKKNGFLIYSFEGTSMLPLLVEKEDKVHLKVEESYNLFDVVLFEISKSHFVLHRIVGIKDEKYYIVGDNATEVAILEKDKILAKMVGFYKKNRYVEVTSDENREYLKTILFASEENRNLLLEDPKYFFFKRKQDAYFELLKLCFGLEINKTKFEILLPCEKYALYEFVSLSKATHLLGLGVSKYGINLNPTLNKLAVEEYESSKLRFARSEATIELISDAFNKKHIKHIFLKGAEMRHKYPNPYLRLSNDLDIYVSKDDYKNAKEVLLNELKAEYLSDTEHDESYIIKSLKIHIELHHTINDMLNDDLKYLLADPFIDAIKDGEKEYRYHLSEDTNLIYHLAHTAKHSRGNEFWASMLSDSYILFNNNPNIDKIKETRLLTYYETLLNILNHIFKDEELNNVSKEFLRFALVKKSMGMYMVKNKKKNKFQYILFRIFYPYRFVKQQSLFVNNHPWAYPFYQVYRWVSWPFKKGRFKQYKNEINEYNSTNEKELKCLIDAGLKEYIDKI